jgi:hypothetical protein
VKRGERMPKVDTALRIAGSLGASLDDLVAGMEWRPGYEIVVPGSWEVIERDDSTSNGDEDTSADPPIPLRWPTAPDDRGLALQTRSRSKRLSRFAENLYGPASCRARPEGRGQARRAHPLAAPKSRVANTSRPRCPDPSPGAYSNLSWRPHQRRRLATQLGRAFRAGEVHRF